ncbi:MFS transporter [Agromyces seonyuensis]|uniref:MFS transporter n=1 Tax=Agromyces seonyuensis TaxID=2662446 RepID=A0A6I4NSP6_9MICO|nr:MFS transporter [Agromyces seonyuensis]MWB97476.1 MFS transporter [Agromyces seonyuensis]
MSDETTHARPAREEPPKTRDIPLTRNRKWQAYWVAVSVAAITILDLSKVNVALPSIETALGAGSTELQLIVAGYVLTFGLVLVPMGRLGDQRSRKALFIVGLSLFGLTSLVAALAPNATVLLIARLAQGVAAGIQMPQVLGLVQQLFQGRERGTAFGLFGATIGIATAFGPTLGGLLIALGGPTDGWRWIFWINVPLVLIAIALAIWVLPQTRTRSSRALQLDPVGILIFAVTVLALMWPFLFTTGTSADNPARWWLLVVFVLGLALFIWWEQRYAASGKSPLIPPALFSITSWRNGTLLVAVYFAGMPAAFLLTTLYLQNGLGLEPLYAGMVTIGFALTSAVTSWYGGKLVERFGRPLVVLGLIVLLAGFALLVLLAILTPAEITPWAMAGAMVIAGAGGGFVVSPNQTLTLAEVPVRQGGLAGSVGQLGQRIGTAIGSAVTLSLFYSTIAGEPSSESQLSVYHHAYGVGMAGVAVFIGIAFVVSVVDLGARRKAQSRAL